MILLHSASITLFVLALFYYWFGIADRYAIFLYHHPIHGPSGPFDEVTVGRYWMSGLVASGIVMISYIGANGLLVKVDRDYRAPAWWRVWLGSAPPLALGITLIAMNANSPTMPAHVAIAIVLATLAGLALALAPGALAAHHPRKLLSGALYGLGLVPPLQLIRAMELPAHGLSVSLPTAYTLTIGSVVFAVVWFGLMGFADGRWRLYVPNASTILIAGFTWSYLALPLVHYLFATPAQYRYITTSTNFFAFDPGWQLFTWLVAGGLAVGAARLTRLTPHLLGRTRAERPVQSLG